MDAVAGVDFLQLDFLDPSAPDKLKAMLGGPADVVLSDMAANATGHRKTDHIKIVALVEAAAEFAREVLAPGGTSSPRCCKAAPKWRCLPRSNATSPM